MYLTVIFQFIIKCGAHAQNLKAPFYIYIYIYIYILYFCFFWINVTQINFENIKKNKESFLIVVSSRNRDLMLMLERPLSHYWTSPLNILKRCNYKSFHERKEERTDGKEGEKGEQKRVTKTTRVRETIRGGAWKAHRLTMM